jgi:hypothetical protein
VALDAVGELAVLLARGYLRLLARRAAPGAPNGASASAEIRPTGLDDVGERSLHGRRG